MNPELELHVHYLCPYAQRALYVKSFKQIECKIIEQDLSIKSETLYAINPLGKVPSVKYIDNGLQYNLYESFEVCEFLDSFPGNSLYPVQGSAPDPLKKALIDQDIKGDISEFVSAFIPFWWKTPTVADKQKAQRLFQKINSKLAFGNFYMHGTLGNTVTMADVMLYPFVERIWALKDSYLADMGSGLDLSDTWQWFFNMSKFSWIQEHKAPEHRLRNLIGLIKRNEYPGLALPVTIYD